MYKLDPIRMTKSIGRVAEKRGVFLGAEERRPGPEKIQNRKGLDRKEYVERGDDTVSPKKINAASVPGPVPSTFLMAPSKLQPEKKEKGPNCSLPRLERQSGCKHDALP